MKYPPPRIPRGFIGRGRVVAARHWPRPPQAAGRRRPPGPRKAPTRPPSPAGPIPCPGRGPAGVFPLTREGAGDVVGSGLPPRGEEALAQLLPPLAPCAQVPRGVLRAVPCQILFIFPSIFRVPRAPRKRVFRAALSDQRGACVKEGGGASWEPAAAPQDAPHRCGFAFAHRISEGPTMVGRRCALPVSPSADATVDVTTKGSTSGKQATVAGQNSESRCVHRTPPF